MHISDMATNPFWSLLAGSDHVAALLSLVLTVLAVAAIWRHRKTLALCAAGGAIVGGLAAYELSVAGGALSIGPLPIVAVAVWLMAASVVVLLVRSAWQRQMAQLLTFAAIALTTIALGVELITTSVAAMHVVNVLWWIAIATALAAAVHVLQHRYGYAAAEKFDSIESARAPEPQHEV